jgi:hypothetical protein
VLNPSNTQVTSLTNKDRSQLTFRSFHELKTSGCGFFRVLRMELMKGQAIARRPNNASALPRLKVIAASNQLCKSTKFGILEDLSFLRS